MSFVLISGRGADLIAGYNTAGKSEKEKYDNVALCKFIGKILLTIGVFLPVIAVGGIYNISWLPVVYGLMAVILAVFAVIYCNTNNRFKK